MGRSPGSIWWCRSAGTSRWDSCLEKIERLLQALLLQSHWADSRPRLVPRLLPPQQASWHQEEAERLRKDSGYHRPACSTRALFAMIVAKCFSDKTLWHGPCHLKLVSALYGEAGLNRQRDAGFVWGSSSLYRSRAFSGCISFYFKIMAVLGLRCCVWDFSSCSERGLFSSSVNRFLIAVASLQSMGFAMRLGSAVVSHRLSCSVACEIFLDKGSNQCPLHCKADS